MAAKKPSMLARQRQLIKQKNQVKEASSKQLPSKGGSSAGKPKAVAQRVGTAVSQKVKQDITVTRAIADNMKRNAARDARQIPADKSPKVRRVGPGGANPKPQAQLPPGQRGGDMRPRGGALATRPNGGAVTKPSSNKPTPPKPNGGPVKPVSVRDLGKSGTPAVTGSGARPAVRAGAAPNPNTGAATGSGVRGLLTGRTPINIGGLRGGVIGAVGGMAADYLGREAGRVLGNALRPLGRAIDDRLPGVNSKDEARRTAAKQPLRQMTAQERSKAVRLQQVEPKDMSGRPKPPTVPTLPASVRRAASPTGGSTPSRSSSPTGRPASAPKPGSTTGASKPQSDTAPKPPNLPKVETETSDAPKPPTIGSKPPTERYKRRLGASRQDMIEDNIRRARKKSS